MRHTVFGAGLIGGYLGAALLVNDASVGWVVRDRVRQKLSQGIRVTDYLGNAYALEDLEFVDAQQSTEEPDFLWITIKCTALESALDDIRQLVKPSTVVICLQNGIGAEDYLKKALPDNTVVRGVMGANVIEQAPGHLHRGTEGSIELHDCPETRKLKAFFQLDLLPLALHEDIEGLVWAKLQLNLNNAVNAISDIPLKEELSDAGYRKILAAAQEELLAVANARNINLPKLTGVPPKLFPKILRLPTWLFTRVSSKTLTIDPKARSSMWCDLDEGRKTEIHFLNGAVVEEGEKVGVDCVVNRRLAELIGQIERGEIEKGISSREVF